MKVIRHASGGRYEASLVEVLALQVCEYGNGVLEDARDQGHANCTAIAKLLTLLVEKEVITVSEAGDIVGERLTEAP